MTSQVSRLILVGNSVIPIVLEDEETTKAKTMMPSRTKYDSSPIEDLTTLVTDICYAIPLHLISGPNDPTGASMPQQPLPRAMFGKELSQLPVERFACESNPAWIGVGDCEILATSGQTLDDICKYVEHEDRLALARSTLLWRHVAPTAPDTLWCYPFIQSDPFILTRSPHIYVIGNQPEFATDVVEGMHHYILRYVLLTYAHFRGEW
ncbi:hypothetical protein FRC03_004155 [Tulasnella sp. 419]|nr:hypothetical protein FRC03_004155 [Tulasnella sp. 419]